MYPNKEKINVKTHIADSDIPVTKQMCHKSCWLWVRPTKWHNKNMGEGSFLRVTIVLATTIYLEIQKSPTKTCKFAENANAYDSATKIHTQFADPSTAVENTVVWCQLEEQWIRRAVWIKSFEIRKRVQCILPWPDVWLSLAKDFSHAVTLAMKQWDKKIIFFIELIVLLSSHQAVSLKMKHPKSNGSFIQMWEG